MLDSVNENVVIAGIATPITVRTKVLSLTVTEDSWSIRYKFFHPGDGNIEIPVGTSGVFEINSTMPEWKLLVPINGGIDKVFQSMLPKMLEKLAQPRS
jgi:hypothetical protein